MNFKNKKQKYKDSFHGATFQNSAFAIIFRELKEAGLLPYSISRRIGKDKNQLPDARTFVRVIKELGPGFLEFGLIASKRIGLVPPLYKNVILNIKPNSIYFDSGLVKKYLKKFLGKNLASEFTHIEHNPKKTGAVSITWRAILCDGKRVLVTINIPEIVSAFKKNAEGIFLIGEKITKNLEPQIKNSWNSVFAEFKEKILMIDLAKSSSRTQIFAEQFLEHKKIYSPDVLWRYSNQNVLAHYSSNFPSWSDALCGFSKRRFSKKNLLGYLFESFVYQYGIGGVVCSEPSLDDLKISSGNKIIFDDPLPLVFLEPESRESFIHLVYFLLEGKVDLASKVLLRSHYLNSKNRDLNFSGGLVLEENSKMRISEKVWNAIEMAWRSDLEISNDIVMAAKSFLFLENLARSFDKDINFESSFIIAIKKHSEAVFGLKRNFSPKMVASKFFSRN